MKEKKRQIRREKLYNYIILLTNKNIFMKIKSIFFFKKNLQKDLFF